jgi:glutathionylspermidine synthase
MDKKIKQLVLKHLNMIYSQSVKISKSFDQKAISPVVLEEVINLNRLKKTEENKNIHKFVDQYNDMLDKLYENCTTYIERIQADKVSFAFLKVSIDVLKKEIFKI